MTKRFKAGARVELTCEDWIEVHGDTLAHLCDDDGNHWPLCPEDIRRIQAADLLEDVPGPKTPGQRLGEALRAMGFGGVPMQTLELAADSLGIKPEGE